MSGVSAQVAGTARPWQLHEQTHPHQEQLQLQGQLVGASISSKTGGGMGAGGRDGGEGIRGDGASNSISSSYLNNPAAVPFGRAARQQLFMLEPGVTYLNHGSYSAAFRSTYCTAVLAGVQSYFAL
ncbi:hypothetical protein VOLCADRAFT_88947 [Volvox carteri f. nagariensis]|uniref:Uncharacterized protein n=1 Tax=Volvox carteri f. nagariensis TaxID=3068 RepID=D8TQD8_VOLCA|nr:uncharacterized protein VOLCADRAFT_88947 [Volvox carteri f. nagariensis]EFJ50388.1 hypothetical protein VOLCADRAFT_88947 [Volvox carteri f. nagariensis]|eukprot:XP_002948513.1 hypothetical protein VOLCADRAFT_88947 [Volvox carteri f. nagariensis]